MNIQELYKEHSHLEKICSLLSGKSKSKIGIKGLSGSVSSILAATCFKVLKKNALAILNDKEEAAYFYNDLVNLTGEDKILFFPSSYKRSIQYDNIDNESIVLRTEVLNKLGDGKRYFVVTYPEALMEQVVTRSTLEENTLHISVGEKLSLDFVMEVLSEYDFERTDFVHEPGQYSVRGSIIDIFSFSSDLPYRIDFFGEEVETLRTFDIESQLSINQLEKISIIPNIQLSETGSKRVSLFKFIAPASNVWTKDLKYVTDRINLIYDSVREKENGSDDIPIDKQAVTGSLIHEQLEAFSVVEFGTRCFLASDESFEFHTSPQPRFNKNFDLLSDNLIENILEGYTIAIMSDNEKQFDRLTEIFQGINDEIEFTSIHKTLHEGFIDHDLSVCCYTDHQIFERYHKFKLRSNFTRKDAITIKELTGLHPGDYVVHIDHGIGQFGGLDKVEINGKMQEAIRLVYRDSDILYVNIHSLHRISKYKGKDGSPPKIYKLGSGAWQRLKQSTKAKVKDIAKDLIALYAKRKEEKGFCFSPDSYLSSELEASFIYEDTPDQISASKAVKKDMESACPMDRLICGDVGFGKTEVAVRAAFKAVADSKQVAVLVPTTILALQHYHTFSERLKDFPCKVEYISRLKKPKHVKEVLRGLEAGKVDIIIGTHKLVGKDVKFKDLGLLVIDEEQKFGVAVKEKLRQFRLNVDTLTMTATPIPRTLQFSMMGARDLSIINTAPPNRHPINTELHTFNEDIVREAINYEISRGGQVFFVNNRVQNIADVEAMINRICPDAKTLVAHGQLEGTKLENIMVDFIAAEYDVLIATTIIENGLDIPNANTIIINNANQFGLSDLHQLRGRVGRSNKKAFCYLLAPPLTIVTPEARRRLRAIEEFSELGSGFNIALQDLDIRGAGNLLGGEQSGFIADIGFETYQRILNEALLELRENEFKDFYSKEESAVVGQSLVSEGIRFVNDCAIETDMALLIPEDYIANITERMRLYKELDNIESEDQLQVFENQLADRFGELPYQTKELLNIVRLRRLAIKAGFEKIILKSDKLVGYFVANQESPYYQSSVFSRVLQFVQKKPDMFRMREKNDKLTLTIDNIRKLDQAIKLLSDLLSE